MLTLTISRPSAGSLEMTSRGHVLACSTGVPRAGAKPHQRVEHLGAHVDNRLDVSCACEAVAAVRGRRGDAHAEAQQARLPRGTQILASRAAPALPKPTHELASPEQGGSHRTLREAIAGHSPDRRSDPRRLSLPVCSDLPSEAGGGRGRSKIDFPAEFRDRIFFYVLSITYRCAPRSKTAKSKNHV